MSSSRSLAIQPGALRDDDGAARRAAGENGERWIERNLSWLEFNRRVLAEGMDERTPLLERVRFLQIFTNNLDEFFMKRVGELRRRLKQRKEQGHGQTLYALLDDIRERTIELEQQKIDHWNELLAPALADRGIRIVGEDELSDEEVDYLDRYFAQHLFPVLTPLAVDPGHPFPFLSNLSTSLGVLLRTPRRYHPDEASYDSQLLFARVKIPDANPSLLRLPRAKKRKGEVRLYPLRALIQSRLDRLFPGMEIIDSLAFRVTRGVEGDATETQNAGDNTILEDVADEVRARRFADVVRLEHGAISHDAIRRFLRDELDLYSQQIFEFEAPVEFADLRAIWSLDRPKLKYEPWTLVVPEDLRDTQSSIFSVVRKNDLLVHHPYESFDRTVLRFIETAASDPKVIAIKMTLYRTGADSPFVPHLIRAAESGKQVVCLVELKARFDEERNILVAQALEAAGVHVVYGIVGYKTHSKLAMVVRGESGGVQTYAHIGTGNYHAETAQLYADVGLFTADPAITSEVVHLFHYLTGRSLFHGYEQLCVAPINLRTRFRELIDDEMRRAKKGKAARIVAKMNSLEDKELVEMLYAASNAGVKIQLVVRGACCLRAGVKGMSENIEVRSVIGRFLEHSRVYWFQGGRSDPLDGTFLIGSADWMPRNLDRRVEAVVPVLRRPLRATIWQTLQLFLDDERQSWRLRDDDEWERVGKSNGEDEEGVHAKLMAFYRQLHGGSDPSAANPAASMFTVRTIATPDDDDDVEESGDYVLDR